MVNHVWGLMSHPGPELQQIQRERETVSHVYSHHVLLMALIPVVCSFIGTTQLGWNFGDGHLHDEQLLAAIQEQCDFQPGDLRCLFLESQPIHQQRMHWRVVDAATGPISGGDIAVRDLLELQPWGARAVNT